MIDKATLENLYLERRFSMMEIADYLHVTPHAVTYWMAQHEIMRRNWRDATYVKRNPDGDPFKIKTDLTVDDIFLLGLGLGLFWGEGTKASKTAVRLGNTDARLMKMFLTFLTEICQVKQEKIRFSLQIFADINKEKALEYWQERLGYPREHFTSVFYSPPQGKGTYKRKAEHGVLTVVISNKKLRNWIITSLLRICEGKTIYKMPT